MAASTTFGIDPPREFRSVAILFIFTLSLVIISYKNRLQVTIYYLNRHNTGLIFDQRFPVITEVTGSVEIGFTKQEIKN
jgi:hypothetical protein